MIYCGLLLLFVVEYVRPGSYLPVLDTLRVNALVPLAVTAATFFLRGRISHAQVLAQPNTWIIGSLVALIVVSVFTAEVTMHAYNVFTMVLGYVFLYWAVSRWVTDVRRIVGVFMTLSVLHLAIGALNPVMFTDPEGRHALRSGSFLGDGNDFALSVNIVIPFCLFLFLEAKGTVRRLFWSAALALLVACVVATKSRGGTLGLLSVGLYYWFKSDRKMLTGLLGVALLGFVLMSAPSSYFDRMNKIADTQEGSAQGRLMAWKAAVRMAVDNPILGVGAGHFAVAYGSRYRTRTDVPWHTAHSIYFLILGELAVPGIAVLLTFIFWNISANRRLLRELQHSRSPTAVTDSRLIVSTTVGLIGYATAGAFLSALYYPHMYVLAGLLSAARRSVRERTAQSVEHAADIPTRPVKASPVSGAVSPEWVPPRAMLARSASGGYVPSGDRSR